MKIISTGYWTFFCNPKKWAIDIFLQSKPIKDHYLITQWQSEWFNIGQKGIIRVGVDNRTKNQLGYKKALIPGIYAIVEIKSKSKIRGTNDQSNWYQPVSEMSSRLIVEIEYLYNLISDPITLKTLSMNPLIKDKFLLKGFQSASMPLDPIAFKEIMSMIVINK